jgi:hypothetical protein
MNGFWNILNLNVSGPDLIKNIVQVGAGIFDGFSKRNQRLRFISNYQ